MINNLIHSTNAAEHSTWIVLGQSGTGKTTWTQTLRRLMGDRVLLLSPQTLGAVLPRLIDWNGCDVVVVDEVGQWDSRTVANRIASLQEGAMEQKKTLVLVLQSLDELDQYGIRLKGDPTVCQFLGPLSYAAKTREFSRVVFDSSSLRAVPLCVTGGLSQRESTSTEARHLSG